MVNTNVDNEIATGLPSGLYIMELSAGEQRMQEKIIITK
jgi:hypothetical protein